MDKVEQRCGFGDVRWIDSENRWVCRVCRQVMPDDYGDQVLASCTPAQVKFFEASLKEKEIA